MKTLMCIICLTSVLTLVAGTASADLVAHYTFDEGTGTTAGDSAGSNDGTIYGAGWTSGVSGSALNLNAPNQNYVNVPDNPALRFTQTSSFTIAFWVNPVQGGFIVDKMRSSGQSGVFGYEVAWSGTKTFQFTAESSSRGQTTIDSGTNSAAPGSWYYIAAVYNNKDMKVYLNGVLSGNGTFAYNAGSTTPDGPLGIGTRAHDGVREFYYGGSLDDVRIYNEALSASDITHLYQTTPEPATLALLGLGGIFLRKQNKQQ